MSLKLSTAASSDPVTLAEAKLHCRVTDSTDDALITALITAATRNAEHIMRRAILPQKWTLTIDQFPSFYDPRSPLRANGIDLDRPPVTAIDSVKYIEPVAGVLTTITSTDYQLVSGSDYTASVIPAYGVNWPATRDQAEAVVIIFSCGYANAAAVPEPIKSWIKLRVGTMFENRESTVVVVGDRLTMVELPFTDTLLEPYKAWF